MKKSGVLTYGGAVSSRSIYHSSGVLATCRYVNDASFIHETINDQSNNGS